MISASGPKRNCMRGPVWEGSRAPGRLMAQPMGLGRPNALPSFGCILIKIHIVDILSLGRHPNDDACQPISRDGRLDHKQGRQRLLTAMPPRSSATRSAGCRPRKAAFRLGSPCSSTVLDRGEGVPYTPELMNDIIESAISAMHSGKPMDADVLP